MLWSGPLGIFRADLSKSMKFGTLVACHLLNSNLPGAKANFQFRGLAPPKKGVSRQFLFFYKETVNRMKKIFKQTLLEIKFCTRLSLCYFALNITVFE